jgi:hypothetical protein
MSDLFPTQAKTAESKGQIVAEYNYRDETGKLLFQTVRFEPKNFSQRRPDPSDPSKWIWNLKGVTRVLYRLPELKAEIARRDTIYLPEGEKDVESLVKYGFAATCNPLGAKKNGSSWRPEYTETFRGVARVVVIADRDETGRAHARVVATALRLLVSSLKLIELPDRDTVKVKDAADFFGAGGSAEELRAIAESAPEFVAASESETAGDVGNEDLAEEEPDDDKEETKAAKRKSAATRLIKLAEGFTFFHDTHNRPFVRLDVSGHIEVWPVNSTQFRNLLAQTYYRKTRTAINRNALADAIATLAGRACYESPEEPVFLRVARHGENILIDLCDTEWRVVEVTPIGWKVLKISPVAFIRTGAMRPLPLPAPSGDGSIKPLWELLNVTENQRPLMAGAILNAFHPEGPYFVTNLVGEQGSAKSCAARIQRTIVDPNENPLRSPPREERDLLVQAANNWYVVIDNLSGLRPWLSDAFCRLATGGGHSARQLYTDGEEFTLAVKRPLILTGIDDVATRPDLAERALQIELETIADNRRMSERELWEKFEAARPVIFSAILNALSCALRELPNVRIDSLPRMADAAMWATAGETAFGWETGTFMRVYWQNLNDGAIASIDAHPVGVAVRQLLDNDSSWSGEASELLKKLWELVPEELRRDWSWPKTPRSLSACLRRLSPAFRRAGIDVSFGKSKRRPVRLCKRAGPASPPSAPSQDSPTTDGLPTADISDAKLQALHAEKPLVEEFI